VKDDVAATQDAAPKKRDRKWGRWFRKAVVQSGRLTTLLALIGLIAIRVDDPDLLKLIRYRVFDFYQQTQPREVPADSPVIIADIDDRSLAELGQWPWPRTVVGALVTNLTESGAKVIAFDMVFAEPDRTSISLIADSIPNIDDSLRNSLKQTPSNDQLFGEAIKASGRVVLGQPLTTNRTEYVGEKIKPKVTVVQPNQENPNVALYIENHVGTIRALPVLTEAAAGQGIFSVSSDFLDGIVRIVPMLVAVDSEPYPSLAMESLRVSLGGRATNVVINEQGYGIESISVRPQRSRERYDVATDWNAQLWVYYAPHSAYREKYISASDIINGRVPAERLKDKIVLVGTSAPGLLDMRSTPLDQVLPGVEVHANILENIIYKTQLQRPQAADGFEIFMAILVGMIMIVLTPMVGARIGALTFLVIAAGLVGWSWYAFDTRLELYDPFFPVIVALLFYSFLTYASYINEESQRKQVRSAFGQYLSPALVEKLAEDPTKLTLGGENREMTFLFSDIRGFTAMSEIFDAQGLTKLINRLLTPLTEAILATNGTIDKYMGDCVMAFWNAPLDVRDHARQACRAAEAMVGAVKKVNVELEAEAVAAGRPHKAVAVGIGLNSGIACVGNMGSAQRFDYSVLGDSVNLASRLEGQSKTYGVIIVLGENTVALAPDFALLELDLIKVKGKQQAVRIFTLLGEPELTGQSWFVELKRSHDAMIAAYRGQRWDEADSLIAACRAIIKGKGGLPEEMAGFYDVFAERISEFRASPPSADWDGVYVADSK